MIHHIFSGNAATGMPYMLQFHEQICLDPFASGLLGPQAECLDLMLWGRPETSVTVCPQGDLGALETNTLGFGDRTQCNDAVKLSRSANHRTITNNF